jgi:hypothetical protein
MRLVPALQRDPEERHRVRQPAHLVAGTPDGCQSMDLQALPESRLSPGSRGFAASYVAKRIHELSGHPGAASDW